MYCGSPVKLEVSRTKKIVGGSVKCYVSGRMRCCRKACRVVISLFENNIWSEIGDRKLFIYVVGGFLDRQSTVSVAASTGSREESLASFALGGEGERVQIDESHVFTRKYNVGRTLAITWLGWVFGIIEDKPNGRLFLQMVRERDAQTLERIIADHIPRNTVIFSDSCQHTKVSEDLDLPITKLTTPRISS